MEKYKIAKIYQSDVKKIDASNDPELDGAEYKNVVWLGKDDRFTVFQADIEDGEVWNETPVATFDTLADAIDFANNEHWGN